MARAGEFLLCANMPGNNIAVFRIDPAAGGLHLVGERLAQLSHQTGSVTVPDLFRARFNSPALGLVALVFVLIFMSSMMVAQFKAAEPIDWLYLAGLAISLTAGIGVSLLTPAPAPELVKRMFGLEKLPATA